MSSIDKMITRAVSPGLSQLGFKKRAEIFTIDIAPDVAGWLGLNRATEHSAKGEALVYPVVGVRFQEVERVIAEDRGQKIHPYLTPTISKPLVYLMPEPRPRGWVFGAGGNDSPSFEMIEAIGKFGIAFMRSIQSLSTLEEALAGNITSEQQRNYRRPVVALLNGRPDEARALLTAAVASLGKRTDVAAGEFRAFAVALRKRIDGAHVV